jgi:hypothetical protein
MVDFFDKTNPYKNGEKKREIFIYFGAFCDGYWGFGAIVEINKRIITVEVEIWCILLI